MQQKPLNPFTRTRLAPVMKELVNSLMSGDQKAIDAGIAGLQGIDKDFSGITQQLQPLLQLQPVYERKKQLRALGENLKGIAQ